MRVVIVSVLCLLAAAGGAQQQEPVSIRVDTAARKGPMAVAKDLLRGDELAVGEVAERVGYGTASTFSTAFSRHVGVSPSRYAANGENRTKVTSHCWGCERTLRR